VKPLVSIGQHGLQMGWVDAGRILAGVVDMMIDRDWSYE
jgi:hypothetical protein